MKKFRLLSLLLIPLTIGAMTGISISGKSTNDVKAADDYIYSINFDSYDGVSDTASFVWNNLLWVCDAPTKSFVSSELRTGYALKAGGSGAASHNSLFCSRNGTIPFKTLGKNYYTTEVVFKPNNVTRFGFKYVNSAAYDSLLSVVDFALDDIEHPTSSSEYASIVDLGNGYFKLTFDTLYPGCASDDMWGYFTATYGSGTGYVIFDSWKLKLSTNDYSSYDNEADYSGYKQVETFDSYEGSAVDAFVWNNINYVCDANAKEFIDNDDSDAITNKSLKITENASGSYGANSTFCSRGNQNPFKMGKNKYTIEFDLRTSSEVSEFRYNLRKMNTNDVLTFVSFSPSDYTKASSSASFYSVTKNNDVFHVSVDAITENEYNWSEFVITLTSAGYIVLDNISIKLSTNDYSRVRVFNDDFENYDGSSMPNYFWNNTHLWSDANNLSVVEGINNHCIKGEFNSGTYSASTLFGLQGSNGPKPCVVAKDNYYEISFLYQSKNVTSIELTLAYNNGSADIYMSGIKINPINKTFTSDLSADVTFAEINHPIIQFKSPTSGILFGYFTITCEDNAEFLFDDYSQYSINHISIPLFQSGFEDVTLKPFTVEVNPYKEESILGKLTMDEDDVINGGYSALCGFDGNKVSEESQQWGCLLKAPYEFDPSTYSIQFRFKIKQPSLHFFYLELGGPTGEFIRFSESGIGDKSSLVTGTVTSEGDHYILKATFALNKALSNLLIGTYGGGFILFDDISIVQGSDFPTLPEISKTSHTGTKYFSSDFDNMKPGDYLYTSSFCSGADIFGTEYVYNDDAINGKASLAIYSGGEWGEELYTKEGVLNENSVYTVKFRYKVLENVNSNLNFIVKGDSQIYIAFTSDGRVSGLTTAGGIMHQGIDIASVKDCGDYYEASLTFKTPFGSVKACIGTYGVGRYAIDDFTLYKGEVANFDEPTGLVIPTADRSQLKAILTAAKAFNEADYTAASYAPLKAAIQVGEALVNDIDASQGNVNLAIDNIRAAIEGLVYSNVASFISIMNQLRNTTKYSQKYPLIIEAINLYNSILYKDEVSDLYNELLEIIADYNEYVNNFNNTAYPNQTNGFCSTFERNLEGVNY